MKNIIIIPIVRSALFIMITLIGISMLGCKKFLDVKPDKSLQIPVSLQDCQALLAETSTMNSGYQINGEMASDNYALTIQNWNSLSLNDRDAYVWKASADLLEGRWSTPYYKILTANQVLETLGKISPSASEQMLWNELKGAALFFRAFTYYDIAQIWAKPYDPSTANTDLGIPIKLSPSVSEKVSRGTLQETYDRIIKDLKEAESLLPSTAPTSVVNKITKITKSAALAALARVYLAMGDYDNAGINADACLKMYGALIDYKQLNPSAAFPIAKDNQEVIFDAVSFGSLPLNSQTRSYIEKDLYDSYHINDQRRKFFFRDKGNQTYTFIGSYNGAISSVMFVGLATDEMYLIRSECFARAGNSQAAMADLNILLEKRWDNTFTPLTASTPDIALDLILKERRKELIFRGLRWVDLRRLNKDSRFAITLKRNLNGQIYELPPNDVRYTLLIPSVVLQRTDIQQNSR